MMPGKILLSLFLMLTCACSAYSQDVMNLDSLLAVLRHSKEDTNKVLLCINIGQQYESNDIVQAKSYYQQAKQLSEKINYPLGVIKYIANYTFILNQEEKYDSSILLNRQAVALSKAIGHDEYLAKSTFNLGSSYRYAGYIDSAVYYYEAGKKLFQHRNEAIEAQSNDILQVLYYDLGQYDRAIQLGEKALAFFRNYGNPNLLATTMMNLGVSYTCKQQYARAIALFTEALQIARSVDNQQLECNLMLNLGDCHLQQFEYPKTIPWYQQVLALSRELNNAENTAIAMRGLAIASLAANNLPKAIALIDSALTITGRLGAKMQHRKNLETKSSILFALHDVPNAERCLQQATIIGDSLVGSKIQDLSIQYEKKYESEKKDNQIKLQQADIAKKNSMNYLLIAGLAALLCIFFLLYRNYRQRQKIQLQRIAELETGAQLLATEAVLKGEEKERSRLAKDLHDGLGGMLSGIKYSFQAMKGNLIMTPDNAQAFERSMDMLDSSIQEMRRVAHNLMPEALVKFGLDTALKDFCNDINQGGALQIVYQSIGLETAGISQTAAIGIYRIVQELINNTLKHAQASTAIVQVSNTNQHISLTVEDDGKGFDPSVLQPAPGIGLNNIRHRVDLLKGKLDIHSEPGKGTSVLVEFDA